jgi:hypothetical protein
MEEEASAGVCQESLLRSMALRITRSLRFAGPLTRVNPKQIAALAGYKVRKKGFSTFSTDASALYDITC